MTSVQDRLRALDEADFDTFGMQDQGPGEQPLATPEEVQDIRDAVFDAPWTNPERFPKCLTIAFDTLAALAVVDSPAAQQATQALRRMVQHANVLPTASMPRGEVV